MREEGVLFRRGKGGLNQNDDGAKGEDRPSGQRTRTAIRKGFRRPKEECSGRFLRPRFQIVQNGECPSYCVIGRNGCLPSLPSLLSAIIRVIVGLAASALLVRTSDRKAKTSERRRCSHAAAAAREQLLVNLGLRMKNKRTRTTTPSLEIFFLRIKSKIRVVK